jgi:hypothetical protein
MEDSNFSGKFVYLTRHLELWLKRVNTGFNLSMAGRIARIIKVFDWDTDEGILLLNARKESGKWDKLDPKDFKFVLRIYYPELHHKEKKGVAVEEVVPRYFPGATTKLEMFEVLPEWILKELREKENKHEFSLIKSK